MPGGRRGGLVIALQRSSPGDLRELSPPLTWSECPVSGDVPPATEADQRRLGPTMSSVVRLSGVPMPKHPARPQRGIPAFLSWGGMPKHPRRDPGLLG